MGEWDVPGLPLPATIVIVVSRKRSKKVVEIGDEAVVAVGEEGERERERRGRYLPLMTSQAQPYQQQW
ncbi:hypothetical protein E2C01_059326 [Portunus trituberculatus]|uniref:Uncharacterized protein n=1 Tax=Portunus trituberculatus TaxID=210409 RepID=A0A5B7H6H5_PORTR|nr:hypothetical protein [Portunus trituberculatus]